MITAATAVATACLGIMALMLLQQVMQTEQARKFVWIIREKGCFHHWVKVAFLLFVRAKPCLPLWSFSLIRKTELWKTNKPPAMQVSQHCFSLQKKTSGGIINVGSPTALIYTGGIHMDNNSLSHTKWNCKYHIGATCGRCLKCAHALSPPFVIFLPRNA